MAEDPVQLRLDIVDALARAWHDRLLDRLAGFVKVKPWGDLHEPARAGYRTKVSWLVTPVLRLMRAHPVVILVGGPDLTDGSWHPFRNVCGTGVGPFECTRVPGHARDFHIAGDGDKVVAVWTAGPQ